jgi:hypothetical protein
MPVQPSPRAVSLVVGVLTAAAVALTVAGCSHIAPIGPNKPVAPSRAAGRVVGPIFMPAPSRLGSPIVLQILRVGQSTSGGCAADWVKATGPAAEFASIACYRPVGRPVTITSAGISAVMRWPSLPGQPGVAGLPGQPGPSGPAGQAQYGFTAGLPTADGSAVTALIAEAHASGDALGISVGGQLWQAAQVLAAFPGRILQIALPSRKLALQLYAILVPSS